MSLLVFKETSDRSYEIYVGEVDEKFHCFNYFPPCSAEYSKNYPCSNLKTVETAHYRTLPSNSIILPKNN